MIYQVKIISTFIGASLIHYSLFMKFYMADYQIRPAEDSELDWAARQLAGTDPWIRLGVTLESCMNTCHDPEYLVFIAHSSSSPVGAMIIHPRGLAGSPYLKSIVVDANHRGHGVGRELLSFAESYFRSSSKHFFLCVSSFNNRARKLYENAGYKKVGEFSDYIINGESELLLCKRLA